MHGIRCHARIRSDRRPAEIIGRIGGGADERPGWILASNCGAHFTDLVARSAAVCQHSPHYSPKASLLV